MWQNGGQTFNGLTGRLIFDSSTLTPLVERLEATGLVKRKRHQNDERLALGLITPLGRALRSSAAKIQLQGAQKTELSNQHFIQLRAQPNELTTAFTSTKT